MYDLIIVGAGPAGLAAAVYAMRKRLDFLVLSKDLGGKTNHTVALPDVEDYTIIKAREQVAVYRSRLHYRSELYRSEEVLAVEPLDAPEQQGFSVRSRRQDATEQEYWCRMVLAASGTSGPRLQIPGIKQFWGRGLGSNILSYSHAFWEREVYIHGDSDRAAGAALDTAAIAKAVYVTLNPGATVSPELLEKLRNHDRVHLYEDARPLEFLGNDFCRSVVIQPSQGSPVTVHAAGFFMEFQPSPVTAYLPNGVDLDTQGRVVTDKHMESSMPGIYAAGDVCDMGREQVLTALGQGAGAALTIYQCLRSY
ncbi:NAD(P)/FAD-dependent oxidoreductase [Spirochaeta lutea]|uniref:FAD/NAD(P)-binding domain-containing protein n=1 Tax=Spirochaeta lutea TaxID=1480694 RepID=A0A098QWY4_9SPIO|nr:NAD(P)/FAD-dependent oxidoreductase [Spirochaeta lutea]KGE71007.1 hypothetical protein DC28_13875 [Spirochaeta lutea]